MSPPTEDEENAALAALAGIEPPPGLPPSALRVLMIARAKAAGATWAQVAMALGAPNGKVAKRDARRLARQANAEVAPQSEAMRERQARLDEVAKLLVPSDPVGAMLRRS